jgi:glycosyltransferase involved in cell wall biosynthesis
MSPAAAVSPAVEVHTRNPGVLLLGPGRSAVSGVATHLNQLFASDLSRQFRLSQFQVGREGRSESSAAMVARTFISPFAFAVCLLRSRPQIVHINTSFEPKGYWRDIVYLGVAKALRRKVVYQVHGGAMPAEFFGGNRALTALLRRILGWADVVVLLAHSEMAAYSAFAPLARLTRIANAVSLSEVDLSPARYLKGGPLEIVYVGRLAANKGIFESIEAMRILRDRGVEARLTLAGSGDAAAAATQAVQAAGLSDRVRVLPPVFATDKQRLWQQAHVFVFPTYHREGLPYALLEAMACGAVPVAATVGAIPDVMQHEVHGLFVPAHDPQAVATALERLANDRPRLHRLAVAAHERVVDHYSIARLAQEFAAVYAKLAN